jgi:hypothetical protein
MGKVGIIDGKSVFAKGPMGLELPGDSEESVLVLRFFLLFVLLDVP